MNRILEIALDVFWLLIIIGGGGWVFWRTLRTSEEPTKNAVKVIVTILLVTGEVLFVRHMIGNLQEGDAGSNRLYALWMTASIAICGIVLAGLWTPQITGFLLSPLTNMIDGGAEQPDYKPLYSIASTKRKRGLYHEAVAEVRKQLEKFPNDFEGVMLLASIHAENLNDLQGADNLLTHFCEWPKAPDVQVAAAWTTMADWHMKHGLDVDAARVSLQKIVTRFPDSQLALLAQQRLAHLVETERMLMDQHDRPKVVLKEGVQNLGLRDAGAFTQPPEISPGDQAAEYVKHLEAHPHDSDVREKLAVLYARDFQRLDMAAMELLQLINEPRHSPKQIAGWLNMLANFEVEMGADIDTVRATLESIVNRFPDLPLADLTRRRLGRLSNEFKGKEKAPSVQLGVYEQNIGLKYGSPRKL
ncbi:MAG TPA: hypothetical protein VK815_06140 [Candidatus Acidoferrales bacterium]|jgi:hypothetical protein|nr:hypothetical protein [Candidatus Acidoferrales bacterium]